MRFYLLIRSRRSSRNLRVFHSESSSFGAFWARDARFHSAGATTSMCESCKKLRRSRRFYWACVKRWPSLPASRRDQLQHALVTEYSPGAAIGWHKDRPEFNDVIGISLLAPCVFRLRRKMEQRWERASLVLQPRSAYLLRGVARDDWQHSIPPVDKLRYSVTFRSLRESKE